LWDEFACTRKGDYQGEDYGQEARTPKTGFEQLRDEQRPAAKREHERQYESKKLAKVDGARFGPPAGHCRDLTVMDAALARIEPAAQQAEDDEEEEQALVLLLALDD